MFIEKEGKKVWDRSRVYGYSDEVMLAGEPEDNQIPIEGCDEELTRKEIKELFPNQRVFVQVTDYKGVPEHWSKARVLWIHCNEDFCFEKLEEMGFPEGYMEEPTYSDMVGGAYLCF